MKAVSYYDALPDTMTAEDLRHEFSSIIDSIAIQRKKRGECLQALWALSDRQWHSYTVLEEPLKTQLDTFLIACWDGFDLACVELAISVSAGLGLQGTHDFILSRKADEVSFEVAEAIEDAIAQLGTDVSDPYSGMRLSAGEGFKRSN